MARANWNNDEIEYLMKNASLKTIQEMAQHLYRTPTQVYKKCYVLKLKLKRNENITYVKTTWNDEELNILKEYYTIRSNSWLSIKLNKCTKAIRRKLNELELNEPRKNLDHTHWDEYEIEYIKNNWENQYDNELANNLNILFRPIVKRTESTVSQMRKQLKINRPSNYIGKRRTWSQKDDDFLINNFNNLTIEELCDSLNKTKSSIVNRIGRLGLKRIQSTGVSWKNSDIEYLKQNYNKLPINDIVIKLQIPIENIIGKMIELNLAYTVATLTNPEKFIKNELEGMSIDFKYQHNIYYKSNTKLTSTKVFRVDFIINNIIIEVQGDYFHCNPNIYTNGPTDSIQYNNVNRDKNKYKQLKSMGYEVYYIWEYDIKNNKQNVINFLAALFSNE